MLSSCFVVELLDLRCNLGTVCPTDVFTLQAKKILKQCFDAGVNL